MNIFVRFCSLSDSFKGMKLYDQSFVSVLHSCFLCIGIYIFFHTSVGTMKHCDFTQVCLAYAFSVSIHTKPTNCDHIRINVGLRFHTLINTYIAYECHFVPIIINYKLPHWTNSFFLYWYNKYFVSICFSWKFKNKIAYYSLQNVRMDLTRLHLIVRQLELRCNGFLTRKTFGSSCFERIEFDNRVLQQNYNTTTAKLCCSF